MNNEQRASKILEDSNVEGIVLFLEKDTGRISYGMKGKVTTIGRLLEQTFEENEDFEILILAALATRATRDKKLRNLLPGLISKIDEAAEE